MSSISNPYSGPHGGYGMSGVENELYEKFTDHAHRLDEQMRINGELRGRIKNIEQHVFIIERDKEYEELYPELKAAYEEYNRVLEKYKVFNILKDDTSK